MIKIELSHGQWSYDETARLGAGGFGKVYRGWGADGEEVAIKRMSPEYSNREINIADYLLGHNYTHVIPIIAAGFDDTQANNFIVMPLAQGSLKDLIERDGPLNEEESIDILVAISFGLAEIDTIVHRDLKPGNVLLHRGVWKLADLGLARFAEAATSVNTMREVGLTAQYAAPEQWRVQRPSKATDVYAVGCIIYSLLQGAPPFPGPTKEDFKHQHEFQAPPTLEASPHLRRIAAICLAKAPALRPSVKSLLTQLRDAQVVVSSPSPAPTLARAGALLDHMSA